MASPREEFDRSWQPRLWIRVGALVLIGAYLIAFVAGNDEEASVDFVFGQARTSLIWVILLSLLGRPRRRRAALAAAPAPSGP